MDDHAPKHRTSRRLLAIAAVALAGVGSTAPAHASTTWGIADQKPATFTDPAFLKLRVAGMRTARYTVRYDALRYRSSSRLGYHAQNLDAWLTAARAAGVRPLVTFWVTASGSRSLKRRISTTRFRTEFRHFRRAYPWVRDFSLFNEPNLTGPYKRDPAALGRLYRTISRDLRGCRSCRLLAGDLHLTSGRSAASYALKVRRAARMPVRIWGLNNYNDVNDRRSTQTSRFLRSSAVKHAKVWITESGGVYSRKASSERKNPFLAQRRKATGDAARERYQYDATRYLRTIARRCRRQIQRGYVYQLRSEPDPSWVPGTRNASWDSGLLDPRGEERRSYGYVLRHLL
ncbi:hypothetical protein [Patulibacter minatonensis]|uniref:hypothetical protein n=1 Tax=Patulibacter minatonensis TaxID=298163 RepID=UPI00047CA57C|nr:hypothetical protein [Patulibacter minatonensis]